MKIPYFPFYPDDWLSSPKVLKMNDAQRGVYINLLALSWKFPGGALPKDEETLRRLCPRSKWSNIQHVISECFQELGPNDGPNANEVVANMRLRSELTKAIGLHEKMRRNANIRWDKEKHNAIESYKDDVHSSRCYCKIL